MIRWGIIVLCLLAACGPSVPENARIVVAGDSVLSWNRGKGASVAEGLQARLQEPVGDVSLPLARILGGRGGLHIPTQLKGMRVEWVVINGGANDLSSNCGCSDCRAVLDRLITEDGRQGAIPALVANLRGRGSRVIWVDYYTAPHYAGTNCETRYKILEDRLGRMADDDAGVTLVDMNDVFSADDQSLFASDGLHPSKKGSARIVNLIAAIFERAER